MFNLLLTANIVQSSENSRQKEKITQLEKKMAYLTHLLAFPMSCNNNHVMHCVSLYYNLMTVKEVWVCKHCQQTVLLSEYISIDY